MLSKTGQTRIDYIVSMRIATHIAMMNQGKKAEEIRDYFIEIEKKYITSLKAQIPKPTPTDLKEKVYLKLVRYI